jgi:hypothetical protein
MVVEDGRTVDRIPVDVTAPIRRALEPAIFGCGARLASTRRGRADPESLGSDLRGTALACLSRRPAKGEGAIMQNPSMGLVWVAWVLSGVLLTGCDKASAPSSKCVSRGTVAEISGNHGHTLDIPADHVRRGLGGTYAVKGGDHEHVVVLTDADQQKLGAGTAVKTRTSSVNGHVHEIEIKCKE